MVYVALLHVPRRGLNNWCFSVYGTENTEEIKLGFCTELYDAEHHLSLIEVIDHP